MTCVHRALLVVVLATTLGLWGCTQGRSGGSGATKVKDLEARNAKLEEDYRAAVADGAEIRKKLTDAEEQVTRLTKLADQLKVVLKERDSLRQQVKTVVSERNVLQSRMQEFSRDLQALVGRVDAAAGIASSPPVTSANTANPKSGSL